MLLHVREQKVRRGSRAGYSGERPRRRSDDPSTSDRRVADRDAIVQGHEECVGVSVPS